MGPPIPVTRERHVSSPRGSPAVTGGPAWALVLCRAFAVNPWISVPDSSPFHMAIGASFGTSTRPPNRPPVRVRRPGPQPPRLQGRTRPESRLREAAGCGGSGLRGESGAWRLPGSPLQEGLGADPGGPGRGSSLRGPLRPGDAGSDCAGAGGGGRTQGSPACAPKPFASASSPLLCDEDDPSRGRLPTGFLAPFKISTF